MNETKYTKLLYGKQYTTASVAFSLIFDGARWGSSCVLIRLYLFTKWNIKNACFYFVWLLPKYVFVYGTNRATKLMCVLGKVNFSKQWHNVLALATSLNSTTNICPQNLLMRRVLNLKRLVSLCPTNSQ